MTMKRAIILWAALLGFAATASAQHIDFDLDLDFYADHYYDYDDDDIYRYGFNINNYAAEYSPRFVDAISREFGIRRAVIRRYLAAGFSPSDVLFGAELSLQTGRPFGYIMDYYVNSPTRNWIDISVNLGILRGSIRYGYIVDAFRNHYYDWGRYYHHRHPSRPHPPVYHNSWSYFRPNPDPRPHNPGYRPSTPNRPPQAGRPSNPHYNSGGGRPGNTVAPSGNNGSRQPATRPSQPAQSGSGSSYRREGQATRPSNSGESRSSQPARNSGSEASSSRRGSSSSVGSSSASRSSGSSGSSRGSDSGGSSSRRR
jgi:uncharacterized membrane protein YgcG